MIPAVPIYPPVWQSQTSTFIPNPPATNPAAAPQVTQAPAAAPAQSPAATPVKGAKGKAAPFADPARAPIAGQSWAEFDITDYTARFSPTDRPERAVERWLLSESGPVWTGGDVAALSVTPERVRVYHHPEVQQKVAATLGRFLAFNPGVFRARARVIQTRDSEWRAEFTGKLERLGVQEPGRDAWRVPSGMADSLATTLSGAWGSALLADERFEAPNGQRTLFEMNQPAGHVRQVSFQGRDRNAGNPEDGLTLAFWPLIADGAAADVEIDLTLRKTSEPGALDFSGEKKTSDGYETVVHRLTGKHRVAPGQALLLSLGRGPNLDSRAGIFRPRRPETLVLLEIAPDPRNTLAGKAIAPPPGSLATPAGVRTAGAKPRNNPPLKRDIEEDNHSRLSATPF
jgi:hypothetical protein